MRAQVGSRGLWGDMTRAGRWRVLTADIVPGRARALSAPEALRGLLAAFRWPRGRSWGGTLGTSS